MRKSQVGRGNASPQLTCTCSMSATETLKKAVKYVQNQR